MTSFAIAGVQMDVNAQRGNVDGMIPRDATAPETDLIKPAVTPTRHVKLGVLTSRTENHTSSG